MDAIDRHMWVAFVVVTCLNGAAWWRRGRREVAEHPELAEGYGRLVRGFLVFGNLPWLVMGAGVTFGGVSGIDAFLMRPTNAYVLAFYLTVLGLWIALGVWVFKGNGADELARHPGLMNLRSLSPTAIKLLVAACLAGGGVAMLCVLVGARPQLGR